MIDLHEGVLSEFADRQQAAPASAHWHRTGLTYMRRCPPEYYRDRRDALRVQGLCGCGKPRAVNVGYKGRGKLGSRCEECRAKRCAS